MPAWTDKGNRRHKSIDCVILARIAAGQECRGTLTPWNNEEEYLWKYVAEAPDAFSLRCAASVMFTQCPLVTSCPERLFRPCWTAEPVRKHDIAAAAGKPIVDMCGQLGVSEAILDKFLEAPVCMQVHQLFVLLMQKNAWSILMFRVSWMPGPRDKKIEHERQRDFFARLDCQHLLFSNSTLTARQSASCLRIPGT